MHVLVSAASKHGSTAEIAQRIADVLHKRLTGHDPSAQVVATPVDEVYSVAGFDAFVLGSAVYAGHWLTPARDLIHHHSAYLAEKPVWLFSSGPVGDPPKPEEPPVDVTELITAVSARDHQVFAGRIDKDRLHWHEKALVSALRVPAGDFRDWPAIEGWADTIADSLTLSSGAAAG